MTRSWSSEPRQASPQPRVAHDERGEDGKVASGGHGGHRTMGKRSPALPFRSS